jgi:hypothetical protein
MLNSCTQAQSALYRKRQPLGDITNKVQNKVFIPKQKQPCFVPTAYPGQVQDENMYKAPQTQYLIQNTPIFTN